MFENFPYTDMHQLNLDWIVKIAKDFLDQYTHIQDLINQGITDLDTEYNRLKDLLDEWYNTHSQEIADELAAGILEFDNHVREVIESLPDYTELAAQFNIINKTMLHTENRAGELIPNQFINYATGAASPFQDDTFFVTDFIPVLPGEKIIVANYRPEVQIADQAGLAFYDVSGAYISGIQYQYPNNPILTTAPANAANMRASYFSNVGYPLAIYTSQYDNAEISLTGILQAFNTQPAAPFNNCNTIPVGTICTYIGSQNFPSNLPADINTTENVVTIVTENYHKTSKGGAVQKVYGTNVSLMRYADNENTYGSWRRQELSGIAVNTPQKRIAPWDDCDTLPVNSVVTYIGSTLMPDHGPDIRENVATVITLNYKHSVRGGSVQMWFDAGAAWYRYAWSESEYRAWAPLGMNIHVEGGLSLFPDFGVIGDSYACGTLTLTGYSGGGQYPAISWPKIAERFSGNTAHIFATGGLTTRTWLTDPAGLAAMQNDKALDLYILTLGINDDATLGTAYIGAETDIGTSADTFYGNYSRIVAAVQTKAPNAKIVISTIASQSPGDHPAEFNEAINNIAAHYGIPVIVQDDDIYINSEQYLKDLQYNHPLASGYNHLAHAFNRMICKAMDVYRSYFLNYGQNVTWTSDREEINNIISRIGGMKVLSDTGNKTSYAFTIGSANRFRLGLVLYSSGPSNASGYLGMLFISASNEPAITQIWGGTNPVIVTPSYSNGILTLTANATLYGGIRIIFLD